MTHISHSLKFSTTTLLVFLFFTNTPAFCQSPSTKTVQIETDWEKIRDAQVQMIKKKEADLDRMKEELLARAQPQAQIQSSFPEIEAEMKKREADWLQKSDRYENEITFLKVKIQDQKNEIESLRIKLDEILKHNPSAATDQASNKNTAVLQQGLSVQTNSALGSREAQLKLKEKQFQEKQEEWEIKVKELKQQSSLLSDLEAEKKSLEKERSAFQAEQIQFDQKRSKDVAGLEADRKSIENDRSQLQRDQKALADKAKSLEGDVQRSQELTHLSDNLSRLKQEIETKQIDISDREKRIVESQKKLVEEKRLWTARKAEQDQTLSQKFADTQSRLEAVQSEKQSALAMVKTLESQIADLKNQIQAGKDAGQEREFRWKQREKDLLSLRDDEANRNIQLQGQVDGLAKQSKLQEQQWRAKLATADQKSADLSLSASDLKKKNSDLEARLLHLEDKLLASQPKSEVLPSRQSDLDANSTISDLRLKLKQSQAENAKWQGMKKEIEQSWGEFVSKETQYQMEIDDLKQRNQTLQNQIASAYSVPGNDPTSSERSRNQSRQN